MKSSSEDVQEKTKCKNQETMSDSTKHTKKKKSKKSPAKESSKKLHKHKKDKKALKEKKHKKDDKDKSPKRAKDKTLLDKGSSNSSLTTSVSKAAVSKRACYRQNVKSTNKESDNSRESSIEIIYEEKHNVVMLSDSEMIIDDSDETLRKRLEASIQKAHLRQAENSEENKIACNDIKSVEMLPGTSSSILINNCTETNLNLKEDVMDVSEIPIPETTIPPIPPSDERQNNNPLQKRGKKLDLKISMESVAFISSGVKIQSSQNENDDNVKVIPTLDLGNDTRSTNLSQDSGKQRKEDSVGKNNCQTEIKNSDKLFKVDAGANKISEEVSAKNRDKPKSPEKSKKRQSKSRDRSKSKDTSRKKSRRSRSRSKVKSKSRRSRSRSKSKSRRTRSRSGSNKKLKEKSKKSKRSRDRSEPKEKSRDKSKRDRSRSRGGLKRSREGSGDRGSKKRTKRSKDRESRRRSKSRERAKESRDQSKTRSKAKRSRDHSKPRNRSKSREKTRHSREQSAGSKRSKRSGSNDDQPSFKIDKVKLRQIAIKNALQNANLAARQQATTTTATPAKPEEAALLKPGGKTLEELTEFCKKIAEVSAEEIQGFIDGSTQLIDEEEMPFIPARTNKDMKNGPVLNQMTLQEKMVHMAEISSLFPVSSGNVHKEREATNVAGAVDADGMAPVEAKQSEASATENSVPKSSFSKDVLMTSKWVSAKEIPGQFTGSTNVQPLSQQELSGSYPLWVKKDALNNAPPLSGGIGKLLLKKMGWKEGEGLGKNSEGMTVPLSIDIKTDRKGLVAPEEDPERIQKLALERALVHQAMMKQAMFQQAVLRQALMMRPNPQNQATSQFLQMPLPHGILPLRMPPPRPNLIPHPRPNLTPPPCPQAVPEVTDMTLGKHPVSILTEVCSKNHWDPPEFILLEESGPAHNKIFKFKIILNGVEYISPNGCLQKKTAKLEAAIVCLKHLGLLPHMPNN